MITAGADMSVEYTSPAAMSTAAGVVAIVLAPRAAVYTEAGDVRRRRLRTETAVAEPTVAARTEAAADRVSGRVPRERRYTPRDLTLAVALPVSGQSPRSSYRLYFLTAVTAGCPEYRLDLLSRSSSTLGPGGRTPCASVEGSFEVAFASNREISPRAEHQR